MPICCIGQAVQRQALADTCSRVLTLLRAGRGGGAARVVQAIPSLIHLLHAGCVQVNATIDELRKQLEAEATLAIAALERSNIPEVHKVATRHKLRWRLEPYGPRRKRLTLSAVYDEADNAITDAERVGDLIAKERQPVFTRRHVDPDSMQRFPDMVPAGAGASGWQWPRGQVSEIASALPALAPGPDGLPYAFGQPLALQSPGASTT